MHNFYKFLLLHDQNFSNLLLFFGIFCIYYITAGEDVQGVCFWGTRFLERKLCKELYTAAAGLCGGYGREGDFGILRGVRLKFVRPVDVGLV